MEEFESRYGEIFVDDPSKTHTPFLFKCEKKARIFVGLAPKTYYMAGEDSFKPKIACKGIPKKTMENADLLSLMNYLMVVFDIEDKRAQAIVRGIRCDSERNMCTYLCSKAGLSRFSAKSAFFTCCGICPYPLELRDSAELSEYYPYKDRRCYGELEALWVHLQELVQKYPQMALRLPENFIDRLGGIFYKN